jgi:DNA-binding Lrp family transcriptional regulator
MRREPLPKDALDRADRALINRLQDGFPVTPTPFADVGAELGLTQDDVIARLARLRDIGAVTRFGPFLDAAAMGGAFCLCAIAVPEEKFDEVMTYVNAHDEVAHNYERKHALNMWFVMAVERPEQIAALGATIEEETGLKVHLFPKLQEFFIGFKVQA